MAFKKDGFSLPSFSASRVPPVTVVEKLERASIGRLFRNGPSVNVVLPILSCRPVLVDVLSRLVLATLFWITLGSIGLRRRNVAPLLSNKESS